MSAADLLLALRTRGLHLRPAAGHLACRPARLLSEELRAHIVQHRTELLALLAEEQRQALFGTTALLTSSLGDGSDPVVCRACGGAVWRSLEGSNHRVCSTCHAPNPSSTGVEVHDRSRAAVDRGPRPGAASPTAVPCEGSWSCGHRPTVAGGTCTRCRRPTEVSGA